MSEKKPKETSKKTGKKFEWSRTNIILTVGISLIVVPFLILGWILISASMNTGAPINGNRYKGDQNPAITKENISELKEELKKIENLDKVEVDLKTGTLRVYIDTSDPISAEEINAASAKAYETTIAKLPIDTYFTRRDNMKMYDLEVHTFNLSDAQARKTDENFYYVIVTKNAAMEELKTQIVSNPKDPALAEELRQAAEEKKNPKATPAAGSEESVGEITEGGDE